LSTNKSISKVIYIVDVIADINIITLITIKSNPNNQVQ